MKLARIMAVALALFPLMHGIAAGQSILERSRRDETVSVPSGDPAMEAAFAKARATLDQFLAVLDKPPPHIEGHAVKIRITDRGRTEFFWVVDLKRDGDRFRGEINNTPRSVSNVREGQIVEFARGEIYDWLYIDIARQRMVGNFTGCALLAREKPEDAAEMKRATGMTCD
jgi:uncharacterized protein YegJ (DUF2314 family)